MKTGFTCSLRILVTAVASTFCVYAVAAGDYPNRPITIVSAQSVGGASESATRAWMECAAQFSGQPFVLSPKLGANGVIAANAVKQAPADGYTLMLASMSQQTITPFIFKKPPFDPEKDFSGAAIFGTTSFVLVASASSGIKTVKDLQAYGRSNPKGMDMGIPGIGTPAHLLGAALSAKLDLKATFVPMSGEGGGITALLGGQIPAMVLLAGTAAQFIDSGKLTPLLTFTEARLPSRPSLPTVIEELNEPSLAKVSWVGLSAKTGSPPEVVKLVETWTSKCMEDASFKKAMSQLNFTPTIVPQKEFAGTIKGDIEFWKPWIKRLNISND